MTRSGLTAFLLLSAFAVPAMPQSATSADIEGLVTDQAGAAVPGAELKITNKETGVQRRGETNSLGRYRIAALPASEYDLHISKAGFAAYERKGLTLQVGQLAALDVTLSIAGQVQEVTIVEAAPMVDTGRATIGAVVNRNEIDGLPINGRSFLDFSRTVAGVTAQQTSGQGSGLSFNGQRGRSNNLSVDGADNNGALNGNTRLTMSQDAVREFQVVTNQFAPEFGNAAGGLVNVISRSGTNGFHGNAFLFARDEALDGRNAFVTDAEKPPFRRKNLGATLGGPVIRNKTFFFASVEHMKRNESDIVTLSDATVGTINSVLASRPIPNGGVKSVMNGVFPVDRIDTLSSFKLDHAFNASNSASFRYIFGQSRESNGGGVAIGGTTDVSGGGGQKTRDQSFLGTLTHIFSPTLLSETRFQFSPRNLMQYANDPIGPRVTISGVGAFGRNVNFPVLLDETRYQWQQSISKQTGRHYFKFGADINYLKAHTSFPVNFAGTFTFASLADFVAGRANAFSQGFGNPEIRLPEKMLGFYAQDSFKLHPTLTLTYGLRYDYDMQPQNLKRDRSNPIEASLQDGINRDPNNWAPRLGINWNPDGKGKTSIRAGYGLFYDKIFLLVARNALISRQTLSLTATQATAQVPKGAFPPSESFPTGFALPKPSLNVVDSDLRIPYSQQGNFGVERALGRNWVVGATYVAVRGVKLLRSQNINLAPPVVLTRENAASLGVAAPNAQQIGRPYYGTNSRLTADFTNIQMVSASSSSIYHGGQFTVQKRFADGFQMRVNYTLSRAIDDASDFVQAQQPSNPYNAAAERSLSTEHQKHRLTVAGIWELPYRQAKAKNSSLGWIAGDWVLSTHWVFRSGTPENVTVGSDVNLDGNSSTDRPFNGQFEFGRNTYPGAESEVIDVRISRRIRIREGMSVQILGEAFNVQNRVNYSGLNTTWGTASAARSTFGIYQSAGNPRQVQLGMKFAF